ncbi:hypothetical protein [Romboutsia sp.]|uniref:hypothetical protein n=1 Tax=Romboutsia sp. TaxID=1965302 RepID=UPI002B7608F3|nr:hypothetical protein [Romboutsia sp.]HSQ89842.1 hypothetical protein [Romboutsia sp.]
MSQYKQAKTILIDTIENYSSMDAVSLYNMCDKFIQTFTDAKIRTYHNINVESLKNLIETTDTSMGFANAIYYIESLINLEKNIIILEKSKTLEQDKKDFPNDKEVLDYISKFKNFNGFLKYIID